MTNWGLDVYTHELHVMNFAEHLGWPIDVVKKLSVRERLRYARLLDAKLQGEESARKAAKARG